MNKYSGEIEVLVRMRYSVVGLECESAGKRDVKAALKACEYEDIQDTEELEILKVLKVDMDMESHEEGTDE